MAWKSLGQGLEKSEALLNTDEPDGHNNGKADVDDNEGAHAFIASMEKHKHGTKPKLKSLRERLAENQAEANRLRDELNRKQGKDLK